MSAKAGVEPPDREQYQQPHQLAGKVTCEKCGHTMTTIKGKRNKSEEMRRYFNCTGKSNRKTCTRPKVKIYAEDLENMVYECISAKLADLKKVNSTARKGDLAEVNEIKLKIKAIEKSGKQLHTKLADGINDDLLAPANQKATQLKRDWLALYERIEDLKSREEEKDKETP